MNDLLINILTHPAFGVITFLVGIWFGNHFALGRDRRKEFNDAATKLRDEFAPELSSLKHPSFDDTGDPSSLLLGAFNKHRIATDRFRSFLKGKARIEFEKAWLKYYAHDNDDVEDKTEFLIKYSPGWEGKPIHECRNLAIANIEKLLEFARHK